MTVISVFISGVICRAKATLIVDNKVEKITFFIMGKSADLTVVQMT